MIYQVRNWRQFQHYRDRNPPWIKLHFSILASKDWVMLDDASRVLAVACMLVASRNDGQIDGSEGGLAYLKRVAYLSRKPNLKPLIDSGFLESASTNASTLQADARPETETYKEETEDHGSRKNGARQASMDDTPVIQTLPLVDGTQFEVRQSLVTELEPLYPKVDVPATVNEMRGWLIGKPERRKTRRGIKAFITSWLQREQSKLEAE